MFSNYRDQLIPQGAKNEALQILCTVLLSAEPVVISNIPNIVDVNRQIDLLRSLGVKVTQNSADAYTFQADEIDIDYIRSENFLIKTGKLRGSIMLVGPLLARFGEAYIAKPGGDKIGRRRLDTHFWGLQQLGGIFEYHAETHVFHIKRTKRLQGKYMLLDEPSVTGTANIVMATSSFYTYGHLEHHFNGLLTNKIPLFKRLNWNLVGGGNAFYVNGKNNYVEVFAGLENILKIFRVDFVAAYSNGKSTTTGIRIGTGGILGGSLRSNNSRSRRTSVSL